MVFSQNSQDNNNDNNDDDDNNNNNNNNNNTKNSIKQRKLAENLCVQLKIFVTDET